MNIAPNNSSTGMVLVALKASLKKFEVKNASTGKKSYINGLIKLITVRNDLHFTFNGCTHPNAAPKLIWP